MDSPPYFRLKIALLNLNDGPHGEYGALLASAIARQPHTEVLVIVPDRLLADSPRAIANLNNVKIKTVKFGGKLGKLVGLSQAWQALHEFRPDIIHDPVGSGIAAILPLRPFLPLLAPLVVTEHNPVVHPGLSGRHHGPARALTRKTAKLIHVHGPKAYAEMRAFGIPDERLTLIRHGAFDEYGAAARSFQRGNSKQILVFGEIRPNKGIDMLPEIIAKVRQKHPDATLLVTGKCPTRINGEMAHAMKTALEKISETDGCTVVNAHVPEEEIPQLFGSCGACLLPYRSATQSGVAMIAMTTGAPLVATKVGDLPDVISNEITGLLAEPEAASIAAAIIQTFDNPEATFLRTVAAKEFAEKECAWPIIGQKMVAAYRTVASFK